MNVMRTFDLVGYLAPLLVQGKHLLRLAIKHTTSWDEVLPTTITDSFATYFLKLEKCRDLVWSRAIVPEDAVDVSHGRLIGLADFAQNMVQGVWAGFLRKNGEYSCSLVLGRAKIGSEDTTYTTARGELESTANLSALLRTVTNSMVGWIDAELTIIGNDSEIALYWLLTDKLRLDVFTRSKVSQFRLNARVDQLYHVSTESNLADLGSRLDLDNFDVNDLGALGKWHKGLSWM